MRKVIKNKQKMKNTMFVVFGVYSLVLLGITNLNPLYAQENGILLDSVIETVVGEEVSNTNETNDVNASDIQEGEGNDVQEGENYEGGEKPTEGEEVVVDEDESDVEGENEDENNEDVSEEAAEGEEVVDGVEGEEGNTEASNTDGNVDEHNNEEESNVVEEGQQDFNVQENSNEQASSDEQVNDDEQIDTDEQQDSTITTTSGGGSNSGKLEENEQEVEEVTKVVEQVETNNEVANEENNNEENNNSNISEPVEQQPVEQDKTELEIAWETLNEEEIVDEYTYNGVTVSVKAPVGSFPKDVKLVITPMEGEQLDEAQKKVSNKDMTVFDISFMYTFKDGSKIELEPLEGKKVQVSFNYEKNEKLNNAAKKGQRLKVYHIGEEAEEMRIASNDRGELTVNANKFSLYGVTSEGAKGGGTSAELLSGQAFNAKIKTLATGSSVSYSSTDSKIQKIQRSDNPAPESGYRTGTISSDTSPVEIVAWWNEDESTIYYYTEAETIYMNPDSSYMFNFCTNLVDISALSNWNASNVTNMSTMFQADWNITDMSALSNWNVSNVTDMSWMFYWMKNITDISALSNWNVSNVTNMTSMFSNCHSLTDISALSNWNVSNVTNMYYMFAACLDLTDISALSNWNVSNVTNMGGLFSRCNLVDVSALSDWDVSNVTRMERMFRECYNLVDISALSNWDVSKVSEMERMFSYCTKLTDISALSNWNVGNVTDMSEMFYVVRELTDVSALSNWDVSNVTDMGDIFNGCNSFIEIDLSKWDINNVTIMENMFAGCSNLKTIYVSDKFSLDNVSESDNMFYGATSLVGGNGTPYDSTKTDKEYARIDREGEPGYFTERNVYTITFNTSAQYLRDSLNNIPPRNIIKYAVGDDVTLYTNLKEGYAFNGWDVDTSNSSGTWLNITDTITDMHVGAGHTGNVLLRYNSTPQQYQLIIDDTDCEISNNNLTVIYGKSLNATGTTLSGADTLPIPIKSGYTFKGYSKEEGSTTLFLTYKNNKVSPNIKFNDGNFIIDHENKTSTIYPVFNENKYTIVYFDSMSGNSSATGLSFGETIVLEERVNTGDYTFKGWYTEETGGSYVGMGGDSYTITSEATLIKLYARWAKAKIESLTGDITYTDTNGKVFTGIGTITVMVGDDSITMLDRNLGATSNDIESEDSYGYLFQWGNNYGFSRGEELTTTSTVLQATNYSWNNPYVSGNFIAAKYWDTSYNAQLWGGADDYNNERGIDTSDSGYARQGPCPAGYHVPSIGEMDELMRIFKSITGGTAQLQTGPNGNLVESNPFVKAFTTELYFPIAGYIGWDGVSTGVSETNYSYSYFWSSSFKKANGYLMISHHPNSSKKDKVSTRGSAMQQGNAFSIRCFKNTAEEGEEVVLSYNTRDGSAIQAQTLPVGGTGYLPGYTTRRDNAELLGWYYEDLLTEFDIENTNIEGDTTIYAKWSDDYTVRFYDYDGTLLKTEIVRGGNSATAPEVSEREGYTFDGWDVDFSDVQSDLNVTAKWSINSYTITIDADGGEEVAPITAEYGTVLTAPKLSKKYYHFIGWEPEFPKTMPAHDMTVKAIWEENGRSGGGGMGRNRDSENEHSSAEDKESSNNNQQIQHNSGAKVMELDIEKYNPRYTQDFNEAYQFSYNNKITTVGTIKDAKMYTPLKRIEMAKMLSYYAINVLGKKPDDTLYISFKDVSDKVNAQYDNGVTLAYQLGIMGINMPNNRFRPNDYVTRGEFATALSRMVYGIDDGRGKVKYYEPHISKLYNEGIISETNPKMKELRGYVMLMLMRTVK